MSLSLLGFQSYMLMVIADLSQITFSCAAAFLGDGYEGKPAFILMQTLMLRRVCLQRADRLSVLWLCLSIQVQIKDFYEDVGTPE